MANINNTSTDHPHPINFRLTRVLDRGWGEMAFEYQWDSTTGLKGEDGLTNPDLNCCKLYEMTSYASNAGTYQDGYFHPTSPPFPEWRFRDPTDGRSAPVALGCFAASQGWAWDRHKLGGALIIPPDEVSIRDGFYGGIYSIKAIQEYRFHCEVCNMDAIVPGKSSGPHSIRRIFALKDNLSVLQPEKPSDNNSDTYSEQCVVYNASSLPSPTRRVWRYMLLKHQSKATMDINENGYVDDSAHIGFGPF